MNKQVKKADDADPSTQRDRIATILSSVGFSVTILSVILLYVGAFSGAFYLFFVMGGLALISLILCAIGLKKAKRTWPKVGGILGIIGSSLLLAFMIILFVAGALM